MTKEEIYSIINPKTNRLLLSHLTVSLEEAYCIYNNIVEKPRCKCNSFLVFHNFKNGYRKSCGKPKCKNKKPILERKELNDDVHEELFKGKGFNFKLGQKYGITQKDCYDYKFKNKEKCSYCKKDKKFIDYNIGYRKNCNCKEKIKLTKELILDKAFTKENNIKSSFIKAYNVSVKEIYECLNKKPFPKCKCGKDCAIRTFKQGPLHYCGSKQCKNLIATRKWIKNSADINKEFWEENFSVDGYVNIYKAKKYHNLSLTSVYIKIKEFGLKTNKININEEELNSLVEDSIRNSRQIIKPLELDLYSEKHKFAIEYNGLMWHSYGKSKYSKFNNFLDEDPTKHLKKTELCEEKGIQLFHIFEDEWLDESKKSIWISIINEKQGLNKEIVIEDCSIKEVQNPEAKAFLKENHLEGYQESDICIGLFNKKELVSVITFLKKGNSKDYELTSISTKKNISTQEGNIKMLQYFESKYSPYSVYGNVDRRFESDKFFKISGFSFIKNSEPTHYWFSPKEPKYKIKLEEKEGLFEQGYRRIWDSGKKQFFKEYK